MDTKHLHKAQTTTKELVDFDAYYLQETMQEELENLFIEKFGLERETVDNMGLKIGYSLSHCQGDGVCLLKGDFNKEVLQKILNIERENDLISSVSHNSRYYHENSFSVEIEQEELIDGTDDEYGYFHNEERQEKLDEIIFDICKELEKFGYDELERLEKDYLQRCVWTDFCELNNIETDLEIRDMERKEEETAGFTHIRDGKDSYLDGLRVDLAGLKEHKRTETYFTI